MSKRGRRKLGNRQFEVRVPPCARHLFGGKTRLRERHPPEIGRIWKRDLEAKFAKMEAGATARSVGLELQEVITFRGAAGLLLQTKEAEGKASTAQYYRDKLNARILGHLGADRLDQIGQSRLLAYVQARQEEKGCTQQAIYKELVVIHVVLNWIRGQGRFAIDPSYRQVKPNSYKPAPKVERFYNPDAIAALIEASEGRDRVILELAATTAMRPGEIQAFEISWIIWPTKQIRIPHCEGYSPKGKVARTIPLLERTARVLRGWLGGRTKGLVFPPGHGASYQARWAEARLCVQGVVRRMRKSADALGLNITITGLHDLRHHAISWMLANGCPPLEVMEIAGHANLETTMTYAHVAPVHHQVTRRLLEAALADEAPTPITALVQKAKV